MLHTIAHYGYIVAFGLSGFCVALLLMLAAAAIDIIAKTPYHPRNPRVIWEVPAVVGFLGLFWGLVAVGLHTL